MTKYFWYKISKMTCKNLYSRAHSSSPPSLLLLFLAVNSALATGLLFAHAHSSSEELFFQNAIMILSVFFRSELKYLLLWRDRSNRWKKVTSLNFSSLMMNEVGCLCLCSIAICVSFFENYVHILCLLILLGFSYWFVKALHILRKLVLIQNLSSKICIVHYLVFILISLCCFVTA